MSKTSEITKEVESALEKLKTQNLLGITTAKGLGDAIGYTDEQFFKFAKQADLSGDVLQQYKDYTASATKSTSSFGSTLKTLGTTLLDVGVNMAIMLVASKAIELVAIGINNFVHSAENAKAAAESARDNFTSLKGEVSEINTELEENEKRIRELQSRGSLTYVEAAELEKLKQATAELKLQQDYKERELKQAAEEKYEADKKSFGKEFGSGDFSSETVQHIASISDTQNNDQYEKQGSLTLHAAMIEKYQDQLEQALEDSDEESAEAARKAIENHREAIEDAIPTLGEYKNSIDELADYKVLTSEEADYAERISNALKLAYTYSENGTGTWNESIVDKIFNTEGIEKTRDELLSLAQSGKLNESTLKSYENLYAAIQSGNFILEDGSSSIEAFISHMNALGTASKESAAALGGVNFENLDGRVHSSIASLKLFDTALSEQNEAGTISTETLAELRKSYGYLGDVLEITSTGVQLNTTKLAKLNAEEHKSLQNDLGSKYEELKEHFNQSSYELAVYNQRLEQDTSLTGKQRAQLESLISIKEKDREATLGQITDLRYIQAEYDNTLSKYNAFINALSSPDTGTHYDTIQSNLKKIQETWAAGGVGSDDIRTFVDYMTNEDMSTASIEEISAAYQKAMEDAKLYFTEGQTGSMRFVKALEAQGLATEDANHKWSINITDMDETAKELGYSIDFVRDNLEKLKYYGFDLNFTFGEDGNVDIQSTLEEINAQIDEVKENLSTVAPDFDTSELKKQLEELEAAKEKIESKIQITIDKQQAVEDIQRLQERIDLLVASGTGAGEKQALKLVEQQGKIAEKYGITVEAALAVKSNSDETKNAIIDIDELKINDKEFKISANIAEAQQAITDLTSSEYTATIAVKVKMNGVFAVLQGIAASAAKYTGENSKTEWTGSAFVNGSWKVGYTGRALVGELGKELLVRNGQAIPIGADGAEFVDLQSDDIIFNHVQTEQLERNGRINSRGKAFASGSVPAFSGINNGGVTGKGGFSNSSRTGYKDINKNLSKAAKSAKEITKETKKQSKEFDWIANAVSRAEKNTEVVRDLVDDENKSYRERLSLINELIANDREEISINQMASERRKEAWEETKQKILEVFGEIQGNEFIQRIMNGDVSVGGWFSSFDTDNEAESAKAELLEEGQSNFDEYEDSLENLHEKEKELQRDVQKEFELRVNMVKAEIDELSSALDDIQSNIDLKEITGRIITEKDYESLIDMSKEQMDLYEDQLSILEEQLDTLDEGSAEWYGIKSQIANCNAALNGCVENQAKWNEEILNLPIRRVERYLEILENIKKDITNFISEQEVYGVATTEEQLDELLKVSEEQMKKLQEQHKLLTDKLPNYEYGSDKFNETSNSIQDVENNMSELIQQMKEYNLQILQIPINQLDKLNAKLNSINEALNDFASDHETVVGAVVDALDHEIDRYEELKKVAEEEAEAKIKPLREALELLEKSNEERKIQFALEQAEYALERARNQKTTQVVRNGEIVYEADRDAIVDANQSLQDARLEKTKWEINKSIEEIEAERDALLETYDGEIDRLGEISEKWNEIKHNIEDAQNAMIANDMLGGGWQDKVISGNDQDIFEMFKKSYENIEEQKKLYEEQIKTNEAMSKLMSQYIDAYTSGEMKYEEAMKQFAAIQEAAKDGLTTQEILDATLSSMGSSSIDGALKDVQAESSKTYNDFHAYLSAVEKNQATIASYASTWEQIRDAVVTQLETLKKLAEEEAKRVAEAKKYSSGERGGGNKGGSSSKGPNWNTPDRPATGPGKESESKATAERTKREKEAKGPGRYKNGLAMGPIKKGTESTGFIEQLGLRKMTPDEVFAMLHVGEQVINPDQQKQLLDNVQSALTFNSKMDVPSINSKSAVPHVEINMGDVTLPNVKNGEEFCRDIIQRFEPLANQYFTKVFK